METHEICKHTAPQGLNALIGPDAFALCGRFEQCVTSSGLDRGLLHLVELRAAQINGCAGCIDLYAKAAREAGEREERLYMLDAWRSAPRFTPRDRAALAWIEAVTLVVGRPVPDWIYQAAREHFADAELVVLAVAAATIAGRCRPEARQAAEP